MSARLAEDGSGPIAAPGADAAKPTAEWAHRPERSNLTTLRFMAWVSLKLGRRAARVLLYPIALYFLLFAPTARRAARLWWSQVRGPDAPPVRWRDVFGQFLAFASVVHDRVYLVNDRCDLFDLRLHNEEVTYEMRARGRGLVLMGAHMGSFEILKALCHRDTSYRVAMAMYRENARRINEVLAAINPAAELDIVPLGQVDSMLRLHALLDGNTIVGMMGDRALGDEAVRSIPFFGRPAAFPLGPFRMAAILRRPVVFMVGLHGGGNRYDVHFEQLADFTDTPAGGRAAEIERAMARYAALLEKYGRVSPQNWFNFYDFWRAAPRGAAGVVAKGRS